MEGQQPSTEAPKIADADAQRPSQQGAAVEQSSLTPEPGTENAVPVETPDQGNAEDPALVSSRRSTAVKLKAGAAAWAKLAKYPWWPAQVLDEADPWIPSNSEPPRLGAVPVRFFGTYDFAWIENQRAVVPFDKNNPEYSQEGINEQFFVQAISEAEHYEQTNEIPEGFNEEEQQPSPQPQQLLRRTSRPAVPKRGKKGQTGGVGKGRKGGGDEGGLRRNSKDRRENMLQHLALMPPPESPYRHQVNLDGARKLLDLKAKGQYPPPQPQILPGAQAGQYVAGLPYGQAAYFPQAQLVNPQNLAQLAYAQGQAQLPNLTFAQPQNAQQMHLLQQQQLLQHLQQGGQHGQANWYMSQMYNPQAGFNFLSQAGGVQGALLAAANQQQQLQQNQQAYQQTSQFTSEGLPANQASKRPTL